MTERAAAAGLTDSFSFFKIANLSAIFAASSSAARDSFAASLLSLLSLLSFASLDDFLPSFSLSFSLSLSFSFSLEEDEDELEDSSFSLSFSLDDACLIGFDGGDDDEPSFAKADIANNSESRRTE